jgi:hypothetical protein
MAAGGEVIPVATLTTASTSRAAGARPIRLDPFDRGAASTDGDPCNAGGSLASDDHLHDLEWSRVAETLDEPHHPSEHP